MPCSNCIIIASVQEVSQCDQQGNRTQECDTYMINQTPWSTNHNFNTRFQRGNLFELGDTTIDNSVLDVTRCTKFVTFFLDLHGEFTGGSKDENNRTITGVEVRLRCQESTKYCVREKGVKIFRP